MAGTKRKNPPQPKSISPFILWNEEYCKYCQNCIHFCPVKTLAFDADQKMIEKGKCIQCGLCERYCPDCAIFVKKKTSSAKPAAAKTIKPKPAAKPKKS